MRFAHATNPVAADLAPTGRLRAAINTGNPALAHERADGALGGISVELARLLAERIGSRRAGR